MKAAFVLVKCDLGRLERWRTPSWRSRACPRSHSVTGEYDLLVKLYAPTYDEFGDLIPDHLQKVPG